MSGIRWLLSGIGFVLFVVLLVHVGPAAIIASFQHLSWRLPVIVVFPFVLINAFDTLGWKFAFSRPAVPFVRLWWARLAGEAFNATTPTASVGGEAVKAWLIRRYATLDDALPSVIVAKTTITIAQACFLLLGIATAWSRLPDDSPFLYAMKVLLAVEVLAVAGFVGVQIYGPLARGGRLLERFGFAASRVTSLGRIDSALSRFYRQQQTRLFLSIGAHLVGWLLSALETWVILHALGQGVSASTALVIEAFGTGVRFASFMVPAHLGVLEGGYVALFAALGLTGPLGLTFSLVRRVREVSWTALGLLALTAMGAPGTTDTPVTPPA